MQEDIVMKSGERITEVITATLTDRLGGELVLDFCTAMKRHTAPKVGDRLTFLSQVFTITVVNRRISNGAFLMDISAEQASFSLADEEFDLEGFNYSGSASGALSRILSGTEFSGAVDSAVNNSVVFEREGTVNRRTLLNDLCGMVGGELVYDGYGIRIAAHRGSTNRYVINREYAVSDFTVSERGDGVSYEMVTDRLGDISVGDDVTISLAEPFSVQADVRVIGIRYNPFYRKSVVIEMGDYRPDITDEMVDDREETENIRDSLKDYVTNDVLDGKVSASVDTYINSEGGRASLVHSLKGEYVTPADAEGFVKKIALSTEIAAYVDSAAGTAQITQKLEGTFLKEDALGNYVEKTELSTEIGSYIDTSAGAAKIVSAASGTFQTKDGMSEYAKTTVTSKIEQDVSSVQSAITLSATYTNNTIGTNVYALLQLVSNANSSSIKIKADKIDFTGFTTFLRASDLGAGGSTTIDGGRITTGTISADRIDADKLAITTIYGKSTYATKPIIGTSVTSNNLQVYIGAEDVLTTPLASLIELGVKSTGNVYIGTFSLTSSGNSYVDFSAANKSITSIGNWTLGTTASPWKKIIAGTPLYYLNIDESGIVPNTTAASSSYFNIGSTSYPFNSIYCNKLYISGKEIASLAQADINTLYATSSYYLKLDSSYNLVANKAGFSLGSTSYPFDEIYIGTSTYYWEITNSSVLPNTSSTSYFDIGSSTYPVNKVYLRELYINGTKFAGGSDFSGSAVKMGGTTSNYIQATKDYQLSPNSNSSYYPFYLGTSTYHWHYAYIGSTASYIGKNTSSKLGFFGTTPVARQTVSSTATVATLITALKAYGLIG